MNDTGKTLSTKRPIVSVNDFYKAAKEPLQMEILAGGDGLENVIEENALNRPALALTGYFKHFARRRLQLFGAGEMSYLHDLPEALQSTVLRNIMERQIPAIIISRALTPTKTLLQAANEFRVPVMSSRLKSKDLIPAATILLEQRFAPRTVLHATLVDVNGMGILLRGDSGVGKSECALALIERGHGLVADDYVLVELLGDHGLRGASKELNRGFMECRGIGIVNVAAIFGVRSVKPHKSIDLVITFHPWKEGMDEERTGLDGKTTEILGQLVAHMEILVRPGRDIAQLVEVAAMVHALRKTAGYDSASDFNDRLIRHMNSGAL